VRILLRELGASLAFFAVKIFNRKVHKDVARKFAKSLVLVIRSRVAAV
jgi:hypothetical protein